MKTILITSPSYDPVTRHFSYWVSFVVKHINGLKDVQAVVLKDDDAKDQQFAESIQSHKPAMVFFNGHGNHTSVAGQGGNILASTDDGTHEQLRGVVVHSLACSSGKIFGEECIKIGAHAFIGYTDEFKFFYVIDDPMAQGHDDVAALFLEPAHLPMLSLASGKEAQTAYNDARRLYKKNFLEAYADNADDDVLKVLLDDLNRLVLHGNGAAAV